MSGVLDIARGAYSRMPPGLRLKLGGVLRFLPADLQYGSTYRGWRARIAAARMDPESVRLYRDHARAELVQAAFARSPRYREVLTRTFGDAFDPARAAEESVWQRIPVLTGAEVGAEAERLCATPPERLDPASTGGTSGQPVKFFLDRNRSPIEIAFYHEAWSAAGYRTGDPRCVFRGFEIDGRGEAALAYDAGLRELRCSVFHLTDAVMRSYHDAIVRRSIRFLHGYPSALGIFASFLLRSGLGPMRQIDGVFPISERLYPSCRDTIARAFDRATLVATYGLSEKVAFAAERPGEPDIYAFDPLYGYTELLDGAGRAITEPGRRGRVVSTGLLFRGMPLIRYETGDSAELVALPGPENGYRLALRDITPRHGQEFFVGASGALISLSGALQISDEMFGIREFQFHQDTPGRAVLRVAPIAGAAPNFDAYLSRFNRKAGGELALAVEVVDAIPTTRRGKRKFIDQRLDIARAGRDAGLGYELAEVEISEVGAP